MGKATVITSGKGGVGKSTLCANLALMLVRQEQRVLVVDADTGLRNLDLLLGLQDHIVYDLIDAAEGTCRLKQAIIKSPAREGLFLMAAAQNRDCASLRAPQMKALMARLTAQYDQVLIDCPAGLDRGFRCAIAGADRALIVMQDDAVCLRDAEHLLGLLHQEGLDDRALVLNRMIWQKGQNTTERARELAKKLELPLLGVIPEDDAVLACAKEGQLVAEREDAPAAQAICRMAARLMGKPSEIPPIRRKSLWARLRA